MTPRITIASQKGGSGKTTTALNLALSLAESGKSTLLVDTDPQGSIAHSLCQGETDLPGLADALMGACTPEDAITRTKLPELALLSRGRLDPVDVTEYEKVLLQPEVLDELLSKVELDFDLVIIDTPSGMGTVTRAALAVSQFVLLPVQAEPLALRSIGQALRVIEHVRNHGNPDLTLLGLLPTMVDRGSDTSMAVLVAAWRELAGVLETTVPRADVFVQASQQGVPLAYMAGKPSPEARRFKALAEDLYQVIREKNEEATAHVDQPLRQLL